MSNIHVLGTTGFIGQSLRHSPHSHEYTFWSSQQTSALNYFDLFNEDSWQYLISQKPESVIFLSWPGLPNYNSKHHLSTILPQYMKLVHRLLDAGLIKLTFTGTCFEYGLQDGKLFETNETYPTTSYGLAKDLLRRYVSSLSTLYNASWSWLRIFYVYGDSQASTSLYPSLITAIQNGEPTFAVSPTANARDFIPVETITQALYRLASDHSFSGIYNGCSGLPQTPFEFASSLAKSLSSSISIVTDPQLSRSYEPSSFWGCPERFNTLLLP